MSLRRITRVTTLVTKRCVLFQKKRLISCEEKLRLEEKIEKFEKRREEGFNNMLNIGAYSAITMIIGAGVIFYENPMFFIFGGCFASLAAPIWLPFYAFEKTCIYLFPPKPIFS